MRNEKIIKALIAFIMVAFSVDAMAQYRSRPRPVRPVRPAPRGHYVAAPPVSSYSNDDDDNDNYYYKGFIEVGCAAGVGTYKANQLDVLTTHGVAFDNGFVGVGTGVNVLFPKENSSEMKWNMGNFGGGSGYGPNYSDKTFSTGNAVFIPIYLDLKYNFGIVQVAPFIDLKLGATFLVSDGAVCINNGWLDNRTSIYFSPTIGVRVPIGNVAAVTFGVTYNLISQKYYYYDYWDGPVCSDGISLHSLGARISIEW